MVDKRKNISLELLLRKDKTIEENSVGSRTKMKRYRKTRLKQLYLNNQFVKKIHSSSNLEVGKLRKMIETPLGPDRTCMIQ